MEHPLTSRREMPKWRPSSSTSSSNFTRRSKPPGACRFLGTPFLPPVPVPAPVPVPQEHLETGADRSRREAEGGRPSDQPGLTGWKEMMAAEPLVTHRSSWSCAACSLFPPAGAIKLGWGSRRARVRVVCPPRGDWSLTCTLVSTRQGPDGTTSPSAPPRPHTARTAGLSVSFGLS